jgi:tetratricopeptide (TPR) repeat protein
MARRGWIAGLFLFVGACAPTSEQLRARELADDGVYLYQRGAYTEARTCFEAARKLRPDDPDLLYDIGRCYHRQGQRDRARDAYLLCLQRSADHSDCRHSLALLYWETGDRTACREMIEKWLNDSPQLAAAYAEHGWLLRQEGNLPLAKKRLLQALDFDPTDRRALSEFAIVCGRLGQLDVAIQMDERSLAFHPEQSEVKAHLASMRRDLAERNKRAAEDAAEQRRKDPGFLGDPGAPR